MQTLNPSYFCATPLVAFSRWDSPPSGLSMVHRTLLRKQSLNSRTVWYVPSRGPWGTKAQSSQPAQWQQRQAPYWSLGTLTVHLDNGSWTGAVESGKSKPTLRHRPGYGFCHYHICLGLQWAKIVCVIDGSRWAIYSAVYFLWWWMWEQTQSEHLAEHLLISSIDWDTQGVYPRSRDTAFE